MAERAGFVGLGNIGKPLAERLEAAAASSQVVLRLPAGRDEQTSPR